MFIKFDSNFKVLMRTEDEGQAKFYNLTEYDGELEIGYDGCEDKKGKAATKPQSYDTQKKLRQLEVQYNMPRVLREMILANPTIYSQFIVRRAMELEELAAIIRKKTEGK